jgi:hypothetical protein
MASEIKIVTAVLALIRGETTVSAVAEEFGVTEFEVHTWKDIFQVAGVVALMTELKGSHGHPHAEPGGGDEPSTTGMTEPSTTTTTRHPHHGLGQPTTSTLPPRRPRGKRPPK